MKVTVLSADPEIFKGGDTGVSNGQKTGRGKVVKKQRGGTDPQCSPLNQPLILRFQ